VNVLDVVTVLKIAVSAVNVVVNMKTAGRFMGVLRGAFLMQKNKPRLGGNVVARGILGGLI
jgi:hypothetical protein